MNLKTLVILILMGLSLSAFATAEAVQKTAQDDNKKIEKRTAVEEFEIGGNPENVVQQAPAASDGEDKDEDEEEEGKARIAAAAANNKSANLTGSKFQQCQTVKPENKVLFNECEDLKKLSGGNFTAPEKKVPTAKSMDGLIKCEKVQSYTIDYKPCESAVAAYNFVVNAETAMKLTQEVRTAQANQKMGQTAAEKMASGDSQTGVLDAAAESNNHQKRLQQEKLAAYGMAVAALSVAYNRIPGAKDAVKTCQKAQCVDANNTVKKNEGSILANQSAKSALAMAITNFTAKAIAAGLKMGQYDNAAQQIQKAKAAYTEEESDLMVERCVFNPTDPLCVKAGSRVSNAQYSGGEFSLGGSDTGNAFNMTPETEAPIEYGTEANVGETVASINSPFLDEAKEATDILNPAGAAQMQAGGPAGGGGGGGAGGGMGGGGASLGSDLAGADKDANKEATLKTSKVAGSYAAGGGGYQGVKQGKEDANPFASLFDAKTSGGIEEDRSIASEDIAGASSGLFQKISKRYSKIQEDKRIEANNLE